MITWDRYLVPTFSSGQLDTQFLPIIRAKVIFRAYFPAMILSLGAIPRSGTWPYFDYRRTCHEAGQFARERLAYGVSVAAVITFVFSTRLRILMMRRCRHSARGCNVRGAVPGYGR